MVLCSYDLCLRCKEHKVWLCFNIHMYVCMFGSNRCFPCRFGCYVVKQLTIHVFELGETIFTFTYITFPQLGFIYFVEEAESLQCSHTAILYLWRGKRSVLYDSNAIIKLNKVQIIKSLVTVYALKCKNCLRKNGKNWRWLTKRLIMKEMWVEHKGTK